MPLGSEVESAQQPQAIASIKVYPGTNGSLNLLQDDGKIYSYEKGKDTITKLIWDDETHQLKHEGTGWSELEKAPVTVVGK